MDNPEQRFLRIEDMLSRLLEITTRNTVVLEEHQRRSIASESRLDILEKDAHVRHKSVRFALWAIPVVVSVIIGLSRVL